MSWESSDIIYYYHTFAIGEQFDTMTFTYPLDPSVHWKLNIVSLMHTMDKFHYEDYVIMHVSFPHRISKWEWSTVDIVYNVQIHVLCNS